MFRPTLLRTPLRTARTFSTTPAQSYLARVNITGHIASKPQVETTSNGREVVRYVVGSSTGRGENSHTNWFRVTSFNQASRDYLLGLTKGSLVQVEGELNTYTVEDAEGRKQQRTAIVHRNLIMLRRAQTEEE